MTRGYSDRIAHALAFAAKHGGGGMRRDTVGTWATEPASVAVILARYGCEETTIVAGILASLLASVEPPLERDLMARVREKFGEQAGAVVGQTIEHRRGSRGKPRGWEAAKLEFLADLANADRPTLEVCAAHEIHTCATLITDARRLGSEYLTSHAPGGARDLCWWFESVITALERHPSGPRPGMLAELRELSGRLAVVAGEDQ